MKPAYEEALRHRRLDNTMDQYASSEASLNAWYYSQADQDVGPFQVEVLSKLARAGIIDDATLVRKGDEKGWQPLATVLAKEIPAAPAPVEDATRYYYLDAADQPVGPFDVATIQRLHTEKVVRADTLVSGIGDLEWVPAARLLKLPGTTVPMVPASTAANARVGHPRYLSFEQYVKMMGITLSFYFFYLIPLQSRDLKAITGRERMEFTALLVLGIVTLGLVLVVVMVLWAYDLERHGKANGKAGRQESLGTIVLVPGVLCLLTGFVIDSFFLSFVVSAVLSGSALWLLQREINLYATAPEATATTL